MTEADAPRALTVKAVPENLSTVLGFVDGCLEEAGCPVKAQMQLDVAVEELFINIANYAYAPGTGSVTIRLQLQAQPPAVRITLTDCGVPYDPLAKPDPDVTLSAEDRPIGGLGIFMVKKSMDDVAYTYRDGQNILTITKVFQKGNTT